MAIFYQAMPYILQNEGGYSDHPSDPGGKTNHGITQAELNIFNKKYPEEGLPDDVKDLNSVQSAIIYKKNYWRFDLIDSQRVATKLFDMCINMGFTTGIKLAQLCVGVEQDGKFGPITLKAINDMDEDDLLSELINVSKNRYEYLISKNPSLAVFRNGWMKRAERLP